MSKLESLLEKKALIDGGNAAVNQHGHIVDRREDPKAVPVPPHSPKERIVLAIMQNQWLHNAETHQRTQDAMRIEDERRWWIYRKRMIPFALFRGCKSGQVLKRHLGAACDRIVWEEASTIIGKAASDCPPADPVHIRAILTRYNPDVVIVFGKIAHAGIKAVMDAERIPYAFNLLVAPHPAARGAGMQEGVREACVALLNRMGEYR